jgi:hypothetical protein
VVAPGAQVQRAAQCDVGGGGSPLSAEQAPARQPKVLGAQGGEHDDDLHARSEPGRPRRPGCRGHTVKLCAGSYTAKQPHRGLIPTHMNVVRQFEREW